MQEMNATKLTFFPNVDAGIIVDECYKEKVSRPRISLLMPYYIVLGSMNGNQMTLNVACHL